MLSSILRSKVAIQTNIRIIRIFNRLLDKELQDNSNTIKTIYEISKDLKQDIQNLDDRLEKYRQKIENRQDIESKELWKAISLIQRKIIGI
jgi:peptidoglycan hydrolase CwlO-like protein